MKTFLAFLLCASLAANIFLLQQRPADTAFTSAAAPEKSAALTAPSLPADSWVRIQSGDASSVESLRALGLSESVINALVRHLADLRYREREQAIRTAAAAAPYWSPKFDRIRYSLHQSPELLDLRRQKQAELRALLGPDYRKNDVIQDFRTAFLPPDKAEQLRELEEDYTAMKQGLTVYAGFTMPEDREKLAFLEKQKRADLTELLTPDELAAYDLRNSTTATNLRHWLSAFDITEAEFKALYALQKPYDDANTPPTSAGSSSATRTQAPDAGKIYQDNLKTALGDERYAAYQRTQDADYKTLRQLTRRLQLPQEKTNEAYTLKTTLEQKLNGFKIPPGPAGRQQHADFLAALTREAETGFTAILGETGYTAFKNHSPLLSNRLNPRNATPAR
jgi:hypothetical protein